MTERRIQRRYKGVYKQVSERLGPFALSRLSHFFKLFFVLFIKYSLWTKFVTWIMILYMFLVFGLITTGVTG